LEQWGGDGHAAEVRCEAPVRRRRDKAMAASTEVAVGGQTAQVTRRASGVGSHAGRALECMAEQRVISDFQPFGAKGLKMVGRTDEMLKCAVEFRPSDGCFSKYLNCTQFYPNMKVMDGC